MVWEQAANVATMGMYGAGKKAAQGDWKGAAGDAAKNLATGGMYAQVEGARDLGREFDKKFISGDWEARRRERQEQERALEESRRKQEDYIAGMEGRGGSYFDEEAARNRERDQIDRRYMLEAQGNLLENTAAVRDAERQYRGSLDRAQGISEQNMNNANKAYQTLSPMYRDAMDDARSNADSAMTLNQYMDPNNQVAMGVRDLYNQEGQGMFDRYNEQAQNIQRQGQANYGVLSSLGAQAAANAMGGMGPMTVGQQMGQLASSNQAAAEAYANTQRRMQALRDAGMSGREAMRQQGLERGFERSDRAYEAGRLAKEDAMRRMGDFENFEDRNIGRTRGISDRMLGIAGDRRGSLGREEQTRFGNLAQQQGLIRDIGMQGLGRQSDLAGAQFGFENALTGMRMGREDVNLDAMLGMSQARMADRAADEAARRGMLTAGIGAAGTIAGAAVGNPAIGGIAGNMMGQTVAGAGQTTPSAPVAPQATVAGGYVPMQSAPAYQPPSVNPYAQPGAFGRQAQTPYYGPYRPA